LAMPGYETGLLGEMFPLYGYHTVRGGAARPEAEIYSFTTTRAATAVA
jgi:hypothetical protein